MGWDGVKLPKQGRAEALAYVLGYIKHEVKQAYATDDAIYLAVKQPDDVDYHPGKVIGLVVAYHHRDDGMTLFKFMGEDEGPYYTDAPPSLIRKLTAPATGYAKRWRQDCVANHTFSDGVESVVVEFVN
jgi:hypothetical protein